MKFPEEPPLEQIADSLMTSFPHLTLKNNEPTEYAGVAFTLAKNSLYSALTREKENPIDSDLTQRVFYNSGDESSTTEKSDDKDILKTLCDQSMFWNLDKDADYEYGNISNTFAIVEGDESPTMEMDNFNHSSISFFDTDDFEFPYRSFVFD